MSTPYLLIITSSQISSEFSDYFRTAGFLINETNALPAVCPMPKPVALIINSELIRTLPREWQDWEIPLIVLQDSLKMERGIQFLNEGADDYLDENIAPRELHARINAILRRIEPRNKKPASFVPIISFDSFRLYPTSRQLIDENGKELPLSAREYALLLIFLQWPQRVLNRQFLAESSSKSQPTCTRHIDVQINRLREKIKSHTKDKMLIKTIRKEGYLLASEVHYIKELT